MTGSEFRGTIILQEGTPPISHFREDGVGWKWKDQRRDEWREGCKAN
jgi:hypothetical protein